MWIRFWRRPTVEKRLALESLVVCLLSVIALRLIGFGAWKRALSLSSRLPSTALGRFACDDIAIAQAYASVVNMVARNTWGLVTCLPRSLTLWWLLRRRGIESELLLGVWKDGERIAAHAWVACHGTVIGEADQQQFLSLQSVTRASKPVAVS
jgi:hypothetical protein